MALSPLQLQELQDISIVLAEEFPSNVDDIWNTAIRLQLADLGPLGPGGIPTFEAAVADLKITQEQLQTVQGRNAGPSSGYIEATLEVAPPGGAPFPMGGLGDVLYIDVAPNTYLATPVLSLTPTGPNSVILSEVAAQVARTVAPAAGGIEVNNLLTGVGFERVLTTSDSNAHAAEIVTMSLSAELPNERVLTAGVGMSLVDGGAGGNVTLNVDQVIDDGTADGQIPIWDQTTDQQWEPSSLLTIAEAGGGGTAQVSFTMDAIDQLRFYATDGGGIAMAQNTFRMEARAGVLGSAQLAFFSTGGSRALIYNTHSNVLFFDQESSGVTHAQFGYPMAIEAAKLPTVSVDGAQFFASLASTPMVRQQQDFSYPVADATGACWRFNNPTAAGDPGATFMRMNTADFATGTELYFDDLSVDNSQDMAWWFNTLVVGDLLRLHAPGEPDRWLFCSIDSVTDNTGWYTIVFTMIDNLGTNFLNGQDVQIQVQKAGAVAGAVTQIVDGAANIAVIAEGAGSVGLRGTTNGDADNKLLQFEYQDGTVRGSIGYEFFTDLIYRNQINDRHMLFYCKPGGVNRLRLHLDGSATGGASLYFGNSAFPYLQTIAEGIFVQGGASGGGIYQTQQAAAGADKTFRGQWWVRDDVPVTPMFTDEAGNDSVLNAVGGTINGSIAINQVAYGSGVDAIQGSANLTFNGNNLLVAAGTFAVQSGTDSITLSCTGGEGFINGTGTTGLMVMTGAPFYFTDGHIFMLQTASALADVTGRGQIWVATTSDGEFMFTDDQGLDMNLSTSLYNNGSKQASSTALGIQVRDTLMVGGVDGATGTGVIKLGEQASADADETGYGQLWVQDDPAQRFMFTDESGNDHVVGISGGTVGENVSVNSSRNFNTADLRADNWIGHYFDGGNNTITLEDNTSTVNWPLYTTINIIAPGSGNQTVVEGAGTTLFDDAGNDTVGGVVVSQGVVSITRQSANNYIIWGSGWT